MDVSRVKSGKEDRPETVNRPSFTVENINSVRPEHGDDLDDRVRAVDDPSVRSVVDGELESSGLVNGLIIQFWSLIRLKSPLLGEIQETKVADEDSSNLNAVQKRLQFIEAKGAAHRDCLSSISRPKEAIGVGANGTQNYRCVSGKCWTKRTRFTQGVNKQIILGFVDISS